METLTQTSPAQTLTTQDEMMPRPKIGVDYVQRRAAELMLPEIKSYLRKDASNYTDEDLLKELAKYISHGNGFDIVQNMVRRGGWVGDAQLVQLMDDSYSFLDQAVTELTKQWVQCTRPAMLFAMGDAVRSDRYADRRGEIARVVRVEADVAKYGIRYQDQPETQWYVIEAEFLQAAQLASMEAEVALCPR